MSSMKQTRASWLMWAVVLPILVCYSATGCSPKNEMILSETENLAKVREAYNAAYTGLKRGPKNINELTPYLKKVGNPDELLRSRTGEPYEIVWVVNPRGFSQKAESPIIIAYEKTGVGGKHYVATAMGVVIMSDEELARVIGAQKG